MERQKEEEEFAKHFAEFMETRRQEKWDVTAKRYVAFIDIMGFKDMVSKKTHNEIYSLMKGINEKKRSWENTYSGDLISKSVRITIYSDSIMIYSKDEDFNSLRLFIMTIAELTSYLFDEGIPHKGACAFGMMTLDINNSIFFGQPLIDAYLLQEELNFYGIVLHATVEQEIDTHNDNKEKLALITYLCPLKNGNSNHLTIYPMFILYDEKIDDRLFELMKKLRFKTSGHLRKYIDSTELYLNYLCKDATTMQRAANFKERMRTVLKQIEQEIGKVHTITIPDR